MPASGAYTGGPSTGVQLNNLVRIGINLQTLPTAVAAGTIAAGGSNCFTAPDGADCYLDTLNIYNRNAGAQTVLVYIAPSSAKAGGPPGSFVNYQVITKSCPQTVSTTVVDTYIAPGPFFIPGGWALHIVSTGGVDVTANGTIESER